MHKKCCWFFETCGRRNASSFCRRFVYWELFHMMKVKTVWLWLFCVALVECLPTVYKYNENKMLEPDLVPVSSTVIPLPVYKVTSGLHVTSSLKDEKTKKPEGPITLITVKNKKALPQPKLKSTDVSVVKEVSKKEFDH